MRNVELSSLQGQHANTAGEYYMHLQSSVELLNLASEQQIIDDEDLKVLIYDFQQAGNAWEVLQVQNSLTSLLYRNAIDYSDILFRNGVIDVLNYQALKDNISKGSEFTNLDLDDAEYLDSIARRAASGLEDHLIASLKIFDGIIKMEQRKKLY